VYKYNKTSSSTQSTKFTNVHKHLCTYSTKTHNSSLSYPNFWHKIPRSYAIWPWFSLWLFNKNFGREVFLNTSCLVSSRALFSLYYFLVLLVFYYLFFLLNFIILILILIWIYLLISHFSFFYFSHFQFIIFLSKSKQSENDPIVSKKNSEVRFFVSKLRHNPRHEIRVKRVYFLEKFFQSSTQP